MLSMRYAIRMYKKRNKTFACQLGPFPVYSHIFYEEKKAQLVSIQVQKSFKRMNGDVGICIMRKILES